ncbi:hypothetical protein [Paractinoplanes maris]|uniref:hypothetical protein n=1 Tax=Paractinoplanes maris TaxID=1734446 RepID=UPI00201FFEE6|nr:hypothetical protein [Actinoplanes maris]
MTPLKLRVVWPIEQPGMFGELSVTVARAELPHIADECQATIVGPPVFTTSRGQLVCEAPAIRRAAA